MKNFLLLLILSLIGFSSCRVYKKDILFRADKEKEKEFLEASKSLKTPNNYLITKNDLIEFLVFTNKGEIIIDPTSEFAKQIVGGSAGGNGGGTIKYLVQNDGTVDLPILGRVKVDSINVHQCDSLLANLYSKYYLEPFVKTRVANRRIFVIGTGASNIQGGGGSSGGRVINLEHENVTLMEVMTQIGVATYSNVNRIKVIRGDLKDPKIFSVDLTHWNSFQSSNLIILPNDIIYIEPTRRKGFDFLRDFNIIAQVSTIILSIILITRL